MNEDDSKKEVLSRWSHEVGPLRVTSLDNAPHACKVHLHDKEEIMNLTELEALLVAVRREIRTA